MSVVAWDSSPKPVSTEKTLVKMKKKSSSKVKEGTEPCSINDCDNWADKSMGGRSLSIENAEDVWGSNFTIRKGRVRVCKSCYKKWKKHSKDDSNHY